MIALADIEHEEQQILLRILACVREIETLIGPAKSITTMSSGAKLLSLLRSGSAESINQLQHAALALEAVRHLQSVRPEMKDYEWFWHPYQTSGDGEPDLLGKDGEKTMIAAEVTASERPDGTIATRMADTLQKLQAMQGERFYFVRTDKMLKRARSKIQKNGFDIKAEKIPL